MYLCWRCKFGSDWQRMRWHSWRSFQYGKDNKLAEPWHWDSQNMPMLKTHYSSTKPLFQQHRCSLNFTWCSKTAMCTHLEQQRCQAAASCLSLPVPVSHLAMAEMWNCPSLRSLMGLAWCQLTIHPSAPFSCKYLCLFPLLFRMGMPAWGWRLVLPGSHPELLCSLAVQHHFPEVMHPFCEWLKAQGRALYHCEIYLLRLLPVILEEVKLTPNMWALLEP